MNPGNSRIAGLVLLMAAALAAGCASMSEMQREDAEYRRADFRNQFIEARTACHSQGRRIYIMANGGGVDRHGIPKSRVHYYCQ